MIVKLIFIKSYIINKLPNRWNDKLEYTRVTIYEVTEYIELPFSHEKHDLKKLFKWFLISNNIVFDVFFHDHTIDYMPGPYQD